MIEPILATPEPDALPTVAEAETALLSLAEALLSPELARSGGALSGPGGPVTQTVTGSEERYRMLIEHLPAVTFTAVIEGGVGEIYVSPQIETLLGYTAKEWIDNPILWYQRLHVEDKVRWTTDFAQVISHGTPFKGAYRFMARNGNVVWIQGEARIYRDKNGRPIFVQGVGFDVTEMKLAERKFKGLMESAPDGIVVINRSGIITVINSQTETLFGYAREELLGQPVEILVPLGLRPGHIALRDGFIDAPKIRPMGAGRNLLGRRKDGSEFPVEISLSPLESADGGSLFIGIVRDVTENRAAEEKMKASLREKEVMLKEIHHRVKNNLQVTSSLLKLQTSKVTDPASRAAFQESQNRIRSMALVHEKLYQSNELSRIDFADYLSDLGKLLFRSFGPQAERVQLVVEGQGVSLSVESAVPLGLIVNELLSNSLKYAFPDGRVGTITMGVSSEGEHALELTYRDDGIGLPLEFDMAQTKTLGLRLVRNLVAQLDGELTVVREAGTTFKFKFHELRIR